MYPFTLVLVIFSKNIQTTSRAQFIISSLIIFLALSVGSVSRDDKHADIFLVLNKPSPQHFKNHVT